MIRAFFVLIAASISTIAHADPIAPQFNQFLTKITNDGPTSPDLSSKEAYSYRTRIREGAEQSANFGGHYNVIEWGCGTNCTAGAILNKITGHVSFLPTDTFYEADTLGQETGFEYHKNSLLFVLHGQIDGDVPSKNGTYYYLMKNDALKLISFIPAGTTKSLVAPITAIEKGVQINPIVRPEVAVALDMWIADQPDPKISRSEAVEQILADHLRTKGYLSPAE